MPHLVLACFLALLCACQRSPQALNTMEQVAAVFEAAQATIDTCAPENPNHCMGYTDVPPDTIRERLNAPAFTEREDGDLVTQFHEARVAMFEDTTGWVLSVNAPPPLQY